MSAFSETHADELIVAEGLLNAGDVATDTQNIEAPDESLANGQSSTVPVFIDEDADLGGREIDAAHTRTEPPLTAVELGPVLGAPDTAPLTDTSVVIAAESVTESLAEPPTRDTGGRLEPEGYIRYQPLADVRGDDDSTLRTNP